MRLWHEKLLPLLPRQQLLGQHRECCALRGNGWGKPHSTVNYVFEHPYEWLWAYHIKVMAEMEKMGYKVNTDWKFLTYRGKTIRFGQSLATSYPEALSKLQSSAKVYPEHNDKYLKECLDNLERKGIHIEV